MIDAAGARRILTIGGLVPYEGSPDLVRAARYRDQSSIVALISPAYFR